MIEVVTEFIQHQTVRTLAYIYNDGGTLTNPTSAAVTIEHTKSGSVLASSAAMSTVAGSTGIYEHFLYTDGDYEKGNYVGLVWVIDGAGATAKKSRGSFGFRIK